MQIKVYSDDVVLMYYVFNSPGELHLPIEDPFNHSIKKQRINKLPLLSGLGEK